MKNKTLLLAAGLFIIVPSLAWSQTNCRDVQVGDSATSVGVLTHPKNPNQTPQPIDVTDTVARLDHDANVGLWYVEQYIIHENNTVRAQGTSQEKSNSDWLALRGRADSAENCKAALDPYNSNYTKAAIETITVPAGTFTTCHLSAPIDGSDAEEWDGDVPFGTVKSSATGMDSLKRAYELKSYTLKQKCDS